MSSVVSESKKYRVSVNKAHNAVLKAIRECGFTIRADKENAITASSSASLFSWGESIEVSINPSTDQVLITISSSPTTQIFDWGKSSENVKCIFKRLDKTC